MSNLTRAFGSRPTAEITAVGGAQQADAEDALYKLERLLEFMDSVEFAAEGPGARPDGRGRGSTACRGRTTSGAAGRGDPQARPATVLEGGPACVGRCGCGRGGFRAQWGAGSHQADALHRSGRPSDGDAAAERRDRCGLAIPEGGRRVSKELPASPNGSASSDIVPPPSPAADALPSGDAREPPTEAPPQLQPQPQPQPQALNIPDAAASPPSKEGPNATPASSAAATMEASPAGAAVKAPAEPEPKAADEAAVGGQRLDPEPPTTQSNNPSGAAEGAKSDAITLEDAPLPPIRPPSGQHAKRTAKPHKQAKAAAEPPAPAPPAHPETQAAQPEAQAAQSAGNPLLRPFATPSSELRPSSPTR